MHVHDMMSHVLTSLCFVDVSDSDQLDIYALERTFSPLIVMHAHDMMSHLLTMLCFVHVPDPRPTRHLRIRP